MASIFIDNRKQRHLILAFPHPIIVESNPRCYCGNGTAAMSQRETVSQCSTYSTARAICVPAPGGVQRDALEFASDSRRCRLAMTRESMGSEFLWDAGVLVLVFAMLDKVVVRPWRG
jgi:hypothetical protein